MTLERIALLLGTAVAMPLAAQPRTVSVGDAEIRYESIGGGEALVFIHGWAQDLGIWDAEVAAFAPDWRVVRYDRRGFGHSTGHADPTADPADLLALLDSLGIASATVVGLSAGAGSALRFAAAFPERVDRLVLYGYVGAGLQGLPALPEPPPNLNFGRIAREFGMDSLKQVIINSPLAWTPPGQEKAWSARLEAWWQSYDGRDLLDPRPPSGRVPPPSW
ncbi:MAG TPA: alpha/beta hydrolase, partial [Pleomorphomonadaceae bacterium]|nr:alpha/beta hydrolase [Pleomorphomonadaceae bacterium]